jgi:hypothetical protein
MMQPYHRLKPLELHGYPFVPFSVKAHGWLGKPAIAFCRRLGVESAGAAGLCVGTGHGESGWRGVMCLSVFSMLLLCSVR